MTKHINEEDDQTEGRHAHVYIPNNLERLVKAFGEQGGTHTDISRRLNELLDRHDIDIVLMNPQAAERLACAIEACRAINRLDLVKFIWPQL